MLRRVSVLILLVILCVSGSHGAEPFSAPYDRVEVAPSKTSIYLGYVSMTMPPFARKGTVFESTYVAKVVPFVFYNESGRLNIEFSDDMLRQLERGEPVDFKGLAVNSEGAERRVEGRATPTAARAGKIKVRVFYSKRIELIFNTTYHFPATTSAQPAKAG
ncbi:MAG: hypothetical protein V4773_08550 [Verrucomicrobiota bacterium]